MKSKNIHDDPKTFVLVMATDEEVTEQILSFANKERPSGASFTAIGAFRSCVLGYFDWQTKKYLENPIDEQVEVLSLIGNLAWADERPKLHAHVTIGRRDGSTRGGHLLKAIVRPTLEIVLVESPTYLRRQLDATAQIPLIRLDG
jgi:hypothetical protein